MAQAAFQSQLSVHAGLGLPDDFKRNGPLPDALFAALADDSGGVAGQRPVNLSPAGLPLDQSRAAFKPIALEQMAGGQLYSTFLMLGDSDFDVGPEDEEDADHSIHVAYALEPPGSALLRSATMETRARYPRFVSHRHACRVSYTMKRGFYARSSASAAADGLAAHAASGNNSPVTLGVSREMVHAREVRYGGEMESVFLRMWLVHFSVLAQKGVTVRVDRPSLRGSLAGVAVARESDRARVLPGVRVNARGLTAQALGLLVVGCGNVNGLNGLHQRADRYRFRSTPLTLYGTTDTSVSNVELRDPHKTGAAIVALASRFASQSQCANALKTALLMFGVTDAGRGLTLACAEPDLHDDAVVSLGFAGGPLTSNSDFGDARLLSLSLFMGRTWRQVGGHMLRASMSSMHATDVDAAGQMLLPNQRTLLREVGRQHAEFFADMTTLIDSEEYILNNYGSLWSEPGVVHSLAYGVLVAGSTAEEATRSIAVPYASSLTSTDDPAVRRRRAADVSTLLLVQSLLERAGEDLVGSSVARVRRATAVTQFSNQVVQLGGGSVQFTLLGIGSGLSIQLNDTAVEWAPQAEGKTTLDSEVMRAHYLSESLVRDDSEPNVHRVPVEELMDTALPRGSIMRRVRGLETTNAYTGAGGEGPILVSAGTEDDVIRELESQSFNVVPTSGSGMLCGAYALASSLQSQIGISLELDQITSAIRSALSPESIAMAESAGVKLADNNFTADQLAAGLQTLGDYSLVAVQDGPDGVRAYRVGAGGAATRPVVVHNRGGHWSGVARTAGQPLRLDRRTRQRQ